MSDMILIMRISALNLKMIRLFVDVDIHFSSFVCSELAYIVELFCYLINRNTNLMPGKGISEEKTTILHFLPFYIRRLTSHDLHEQLYMTDSWELPLLRFCTWI